MDLNDISNDEATNDYSSFWKSIPDPPTPTPPAALPEKPTDHGDGAASRRRRRRESLAPLKDVTNYELMESDVDVGKSLKVMKTEDKAGSSYFSELDDSDDIGLTRSKKSKRRRSLILPSDDGVKILTEVEAVSETAVKSNETSPHNDDLTTNETLVQLVRKYCSLPPELRANSHESKAIESISGYPLSGKVHNLYDPETSKPNHEFLLKSKPVIQLMEEQKQKDIDEARSYTHCEVKKTRGGFQYVDVNTLEVVSSEEYRDRYCAMIRDRREERKQAAVGGASEGNDEPSTDEKESPFAEDSNMDMSAMSIDDSLVNADDNIVLSSRATSVPSTISTVANKKAEASVSTKQADTSDNNSDPSLLAPPAKIEPAPQNVVFAGAMPPSDDPRVMAAREKLFHAIDTALAEYSSKILALQDEKSGG